MFFDGLKLPAAHRLVSAGGELAGSPAKGAFKAECGLHSRFSRAVSVLQAWEGQAGV